MTGSITVVSPIYKGGLWEAAALADSVWAAIPARCRVVLDYGGFFGHMRAFEEQRDPSALASLSVADQLVREAQDARGARMLRWDDPVRGDRDLAVDLQGRGVSVLITTRWFLDVRGAGEQELLRFIAHPDCRVIGYVYDRNDYSARSVEAIHEVAGDRLLTITGPPQREVESAIELPGRSIVASLTDWAPVPEWLSSVVRHHVWPAG